MFFVLSKTLGLLADPALLALASASLALVLRWRGLWPRLGRALALASVLILLAFGCGVVADGLLRPLEQVHRRPTGPVPSPAAIVVLAGLLELQTLPGAFYEMSSAADRVVEGIRLARRFPRALLVMSGGSGDLFRSARPEALVLGRLARELGIPAERLRLERESRNTHENARYTAKLLRDLEGPVLLVTSAFHMPRSVACFAKAGRRVVPWPADSRRVDRGHWESWVPRPAHLERSALALREYVGLVAYRIAGYL